MRSGDDRFDSFGSLLKGFRTRQHLTQQQLANKLGVRRNTVGAWERGEVLPSTKTMVLELARHLKLDDQETRQLLEASLTALAPYWSVPLPRNPYFTGREDILEALHTQLGIDQTVALIHSSALHGLGGVGKTQIALEYTYRHVNEYSAVFWMTAETEEQIATGIQQIAETLQLPEREEKDQQRVIAAVQGWLRSHGQWLLIWDNVEDLALLDRFLPSARSGAVLLTTRLQALGTFAQGLDLQPMKREEALLFLLLRAKILEPGAAWEHIQTFARHRPEDDTSASEIVALLAGLPLALDQAGAYLEETHCGLPTYLALLRSRLEGLLHYRGEQVRAHPDSVASTFSLSFTATAERHPAVHDLLQVCALLSPDAIPEEVFLQGASYLGETLATACHDVLAWNQVAASACTYSLLHRQPEAHTFSMHRLVQAVLKDLLSEEAQHTWKSRVLCAMSHLFPSEETEQADYWQQCERLLPHALLCLTWNQQERQRVTLMARVATYFLRRSRLVEAEALYLQALHLGEHTLGVDHPQVSEVLTGLAHLHINQRKYAEAEALYLQALHLGEHTLGVDHPQVSEVLYQMAMLYYVQRRYAEAEPLYQRALCIREHILEPDHPRIATVLQGLAMLYDDLGRYTEAETFYQKALSIREHALGVNHPQVATVLNNLAANYRDRGRDAEAALLFQRALYIWEQTLGSEHPRVAYPLSGLAKIHRDHGRYTEAESLFQRALHIREQTQGPESPEVAGILNNLALLFQKQGRDANVEALFQRALSIREQHLGPQHPETAQTLYDLALFQQQQGKPGEARTLAERALLICSQSLGDTHPQTMTTRTLHAQLAQETGHVAETAPAQGQPSTTREQPLLPAMNVAVGRESGHVAYTRRVSMREVTFTCTICGQTVTQLHYPSGRLKHCSDACRAASVAGRQEARVSRQREKRRSTRKAQPQASQE